MFTILCDMWLLMQMIVTICLSCWLYGEIRKPAIEQQIVQATADLDTEVKVLSSDAVHKCTCTARADVQ